MMNMDTMTLDIELYDLLQWDKLKQDELKRTIRRYKNVKQLNFILISTNGYKTPPFYLVSRIFYIVRRLFKKEGAFEVFVHVTLFEKSEIHRMVSIKINKDRGKRIVYLQDERITFDFWDFLKMRSDTMEIFINNVIEALKYNPFIYTHMLWIYPVFSQESEFAHLNQEVILETRNIECHVTKEGVAIHKNLCGLYNIKFLGVAGPGPKCIMHMLDLTPLDTFCSLQNK